MHFNVTSSRMRDVCSVLRSAVDWLAACQLLRVVVFLLVYRIKVIALLFWKRFCLVIGVHFLGLAPTQSEALSFPLNLFLLRDVKCFHLVRRQSAVLNSAAKMRNNCLNTRFLMPAYLAIFDVAVSRIQLA